jgi:uncharacterized protein (DUF58 family)
MTTLDPHTLAKLKGLHLRARHIVEGYVAGQHRSPYQGFSIEFAEHREYSPGDDLRHLDWKVYGKTDKLYLKQYEDETNLICHLVVDASESMTYRGPGSALSKLESAQCVAAALAWLVLHQQDAVGLVTFDQQIRQAIRPSSSPAQLKQIVQALESAQASAKTATGPILHELAKRWNKRAIVMLFTDAFDDVNTLLAGLKHLRHQRHDVALFHVLDRAELEFPFQSPLEFQGLEAWPQVQADPRGLSDTYRREFEAFRKRLEQGCRAQRVDYILLRTDRPIDLMLASYLHGRGG